MIFQAVTCSGLFAQEASLDLSGALHTEGISVSLGWQTGGYTEKTYSNIFQEVSAISLNIAADFFTSDGKCLHTIKAGYVFAKPESVMTKQPVISQSIDPITGEVYYLPILTVCNSHRAFLEYSFKLPLNEKETYLGMTSRADVYIQLANYPSVTGIISFGPAFEQRFNVDDNNTFKVAVSSPFLGYAVRPPFAGCDALFMTYAEKDPLKIATLGTFVSLHNYWAAFISCDYDHKVNRFLTLKTGADLELSRINVPVEKPRKDFYFNIRSGLEVNY